VRKPDAHVPDVYMPAQPDVDVDSVGAEPAVPLRMWTSGSPRHVGGVGVDVRVGEMAAEGVRVRRRVIAPLGEREGEIDLVAVMLRVAEPTAVVDSTPITVTAGVTVRVEDATLIELNDGEFMVVDDSVPVTENDTNGDKVCVEVCVCVCVCVGAELTV
jgi:hypothetical protein